MATFTTCQAPLNLKDVTTGRSIVMDESRNSKGQFVRTRVQSWDDSDWDNGFVNDRGRFMVYCPEFPAATDAGWAHRARVVYWQRTGHVTKRGVDVIHHIDEDKLNDVFDNLEVRPYGLHTAEHNAKPKVKCVCATCGCVFFLPQWRINQGKGDFCSLDCYHRYPVSDEIKKKRLDASLAVRRANKAKRGES